ncbi:MAG: hypothetical protein HY938_02475 [Nitrosomonadales bacterium]|nr:hypothetical protein [Nitrosomonadales bacterium]
MARNLLKFTVLPCLVAFAAGGLVFLAVTWWSSRLEISIVILNDSGLEVEGVVIEGTGSKVHISKIGVGAVTQLKYRIPGEGTYVLSAKLREGQSISTSTGLYVESGDLVIEVIERDAIKTFVQKSSY